MPVEEVKDSISVVEARPKATIRPGENLETFIGEAGLALQDELAKATYKIEIQFSRHRSPNKGVPSPSMILIWESGKKFHGGGDQRMYWCGHDDCGKPLSSDNFGYMHVVCPKCNREMFLDPKAKEAHRRDMMSRGLDPRDLSNIPYVVGERLVNLTPSNLAVLLEKTWRQLDGDADIYIKYSPYDIRYHKGDNEIEVAEKLGKVRTARRPVIYPLKNIIKDLHAGASLQHRFIALVTS